MKARNVFPFLLSCGLHFIVFLFLIISFERTVFMPADTAASLGNNVEEKKVIEAVMVDARIVEAEKAKLDAIEAKKKAEAGAREKELAFKREQLRQEEVLMNELKKKNEEAKEALRKEAEKQLAEQKKWEVDRLAQLKQAELARNKQKALANEKAAAEKARQQAVKQAAAKEAAAMEKAVQQQRQKQDEISRYAMLIRNKIHQYWRQPIGMEFAGFTCKIEVRLLPTGEVLDASVIESSGNLEFDRSSEVAVRKASPLPMPNESDIAREFHKFTFTFKPEPEAA